MLRSYTVRLVALTLDCDPKWIDNLLSHHAVPGVHRGRRGVERRVSDDAIVVIEAARILSSELGVPLSKAIALAVAASRQRGTSPHGVVSTSGISIVLPFADIEARLRHRIVDAVEALGRIRRGRPRVRKPHE